MEKIPEQTYFKGVRIVIFGPESTGKSTLAKQLSAHYGAPVVEEFAREYLQELFDANGHICTYEDLIPIAHGHRLAENAAVKEATDLLILDTDILETYVYSIIYFNRAPRELENALQASRYDHYLLLDVDTPWVADNLRDKPHERSSIFHKFEKSLKEFNLPYTKISGLGDLRLQNAVAAINPLL